MGEQTGGHGRFHDAGAKPPVPIWLVNGEGFGNHCSAFDSGVRHINSFQQTENNEVKINIMFWNLNKKHLLKQINNLAINYGVHVFFFAECTIPPEDVLKTLNALNTSYYYAPKIGCEKLEVFTKFPSKYISPIKETSRTSIRKLNLPNCLEILLAAVHLPSKQNWSDNSQSLECSEVSRVIVEAEEAAGHKRTILLGDLNMHPFEHGVVAASGLHGTMSRQIASKGCRVLNGRKHYFFYNPMWNLLGDIEQPLGSFYYNNSEQVNYYWGFLDQVLIRSDLLDRFSNDDLKVLTSDGDNSLLNSSSIPDKDKFSDHLPILFSIEI